MEYINFINDVCNMVQDELGAEYEVIHDCVLKNNSSSMDSVVIRAPHDQIAPSIYLKKYYDNYVAGQSISSIVQEVVEFYNNNRLQKKDIAGIIGNLKDFNAIKDKIVVRMINADMNESIQEQCPHIRYLDFLLTFHYLLDIESENDASIRINNDLFNCWSIDIDDLLETAVDNTVKLLPAKVEPIASIIDGLLGHDFCYEEDIDTKDLPQLLIATNNMSNYGAVCILYNGLLAEIAEKLNSDLVILPSSVHEVIIFSYTDENELPRYLKMVEEVNDTQLDVTELLSYNVYVYYRECGEIKIYPADFL